MSLTHILTPLRIADCEIRNRVVRAAHTTYLAPGTINDDLIAYHVARGNGGVGLSFMEVLGIHPTTPAGINAFHPGIGDGFRKLIDAVRPTGMKMFQQLWHAGHHSPPIDGSPPWSASDRPSVVVDQVAIPMTKMMIDTVIEAYASTARHCFEWGLDGVEIHAAHGYLPAQFLSPATNDREDDYGGSFENRVRFLHEVMAAVRAAVPAGFPIGIRIAPDEGVGGADVEANLKAALYLEERSLLDFVDISLGNYQTFPKIMGGMHEPAGYEMPTSSAISRQLRTPVIVGGRFRTLEEADEVIRAGDAAMVSFVRALIADPDLVRKTVAGTLEQVRPCIACNQGCVARVIAPPHRMGCTVNAGAGSELILGDDRLIPAPVAKRLLVIGGGPAGMEAARVAALRGHRVVLAEAASRLGGSLAVAAKAPTRHGIRDITDWLEQEIYRLGVEVRLSSYVDAEDVDQADWDAVIVATGSIPRGDGVQMSHPGEPILGFDQPHVLTSTDLMLADHRRELGRNAVVIDDAGHYEGLAAAEYLASRGVEVAFVTRHISIAPRVQAALMVEPALSRMAGTGFSAFTRTRALSIGATEVTVAPDYLPATTNQISTLPADLVVFVSHNRPNRDLYQALAEEAFPTWIVGDANSPRYLPTAIYEGHLAGAQV